LNNKNNLYKKEIKKTIPFIKVSEEIPRWQLEGGSRKHASYNEILDRHGRHTLQAKPLKRGKTLTPPHLQLVQSTSTSH
jgi:hypothetical protein